MLTRQNLVLVNSLEKCKGGPFTRKKLVNGKLEKACLDYIIVCPLMSSHLTNAIIDSVGLHAFVKYWSTKGVPKVVKSDHHTFVVDFELKWQLPAKPLRREIYKLRDEDGLNRFQALTNISPDLIECMNTKYDLETATNKWYKLIDVMIARCFKKIRVSKKPPRRSVDFKLYTLFQELQVMKRLMVDACEMCHHVLKTQLSQCENNIAMIISERKKSQVENTCKNLIDTNGKFLHLNAWRLKKNLYPNYKDAPPAVM